MGTAFYLHDDYPNFNRSAFTPQQPATGMVEIVGAAGHSLTLTFGARAKSGHDAGIPGLAGGAVEAPRSCSSTPTSRSPDPSTISSQLTTCWPAPRAIPPPSRRGEVISVSRTHTQTKDLALAYMSAPLIPVNSKPAPCG